MHVILKILIGVLAAPFILAFLALLTALLLLYVLTLVGPLYHVYRLRQEAELISIESLMKQDLGFNYFQSRRGRLAYRWTIPADSEDPNKNKRKHKCPIVLPGGLGSTMININIWHDRLFKAGFRVLSYDRIDVGTSDDNYQDSKVTAVDTVEDMHALLEQVCPNEKWIVVGGSFGNLVGELFTGHYPQSVAGIVNIDGLPYPLGLDPKVCKGFETVAKIYKVETFLSKLGLFRPLIHLMTSKLPKTTYKDCLVPLEITLAQIQSPRTLSSIATETMLMMDFGQQAGSIENPNGWGKVGKAAIPQEIFDEMIHCKGDFVIKDSQKSPSETITPNTMVAANNAYNMAIAARLSAIENKESKLAQRWREIPVRCLSGRNYDYDPYELFMTKEMKDLYAYEHAFLAMFARNGRRWEFPNESHGSLPFSGTEYLVAATMEVADLAERFEEEDKTSV